MPFIYGEEEKKTDGLPDGVSEEDFRNLIAAMIDDGVAVMIREALDDQLYITQKSGALVWRHTGKIVDEPDRPRGKK